MKAIIHLPVLGLTVLLTSSFLTPAHADLTSLQFDKEDSVDVRCVLELKDSESVRDSVTGYKLHDIHFSYITYDNNVRRAVLKRWGEVTPPYTGLKPLPSPGAGDHLKTDRDLKMLTESLRKNLCAADELKRVRESQRYVLSPNETLVAFSENYGFTFPRGQDDYTLDPVTRYPVHRTQNEVNAIRCAPGPIHDMGYSEKPHVTVDAFWVGPKSNGVILYQFSSTFYNNNAMQYVQSDYSCLLPQGKLVESFHAIMRRFSDGQFSTQGHYKFGN